MDLQLANSIAVVTGGASGIGRATAECFVDEGAQVALWDVQPDVEDVASHIGSEVVGLKVDVADLKSVQAALAETEYRLGSVDHLVHAAAIGSGKFGFPYTNLTPDDWPRVLEVNVMGMVIVAHAIGPAMRDRGHGSMVFVASVAGQIGSPTDPPYSASKAANINFAQCLAKDLAPHGVRVNTVCPGMVKTPLNRSVWQAWHDRQPESEGQSYDDWAAEKIRDIVPLGRWQEPSDIAEAIVFLSSIRARNITGQTINVDGGYVMHW